MHQYFGLGDKTLRFGSARSSFSACGTLTLMAGRSPLTRFTKAFRFISVIGPARRSAYLSTTPGPVRSTLARLSPIHSNIAQKVDRQTSILFYGPTAKHVLENYAWLTGPTPLPPLWALGFQQSRYSYMSQERVLEVADRLRKDKIPADAIYLDIDYQDRNRPFTINKQAFPDLSGMITSLHNEKFHVVAITDLHIADVPGEKYSPFDSGIAGDHFVKNADGSLFVGPVWPGPSVFPDFTQQSTKIRRVVPISIFTKSLESMASERYECGLSVFQLPGRRCREYRHRGTSD